jgi:predicted AAA+ superfamily ATPase
MITGPRQCGKTTLVRGFTSHQHITLDDDTVLEAARGDPSGFVRGLDQAIVDEVQRAPDLLRAIKKTIDVALVLTLTTINAWNRLAITMRTEVGNYQPKARPVSKTA